MSRLARIGALAAKEVVQLIRDRATLGMLLGIPLIQVLLFGFAIELTPRAVSVTVVGSPEAVTLVQPWFENDAIAATMRHALSAAEAQRLLARGQTLIVIDLDAAPVRVSYDASDPVLAASARAAIDRLTDRLSGRRNALINAASEVRVDPLFNPGARTQPYLVSGLLGLILTMTLVMMSALSVARERERGTLEGLMALGVRPIELCAGKLAPYFVLGLLQGGAVLLIARVAFAVSVQGSVIWLAVSTAVFAFVNLAIGCLFSNLAKAQMPAMQMTFFFFLPSSLLSGFMFPFSAMPGWARAIGEALPLTHFLRIARGIVLRGVDVDYVQGELAPLALMALLVSGAALAVCRRTLRAGPT